MWTKEQEEVLEAMLQGRWMTCQDIKNRLKGKASAYTARRISSLLDGPVMLGQVKLEPLQNAGNLKAYKKVAG